MLTTEDQENADPWTDDASYQAQRGHLARKTGE
jgi:hypothetical protein